MVFSGLILLMIDWKGRKNTLIFMGFMIIGTSLGAILVPNLFIKMGLISFTFSLGAPVPIIYAILLKECTLIDSKINN